MTVGEPREDPIDRLSEAVRRLSRLTQGRAKTGLSHHDADADIGTVASDEALSFDPLGLLRTFHEAGARVVVMGQVAGIMHGSRELTGDLDLLWDGDPAQRAALASAFASVGAALCDQNDRQIACEAVAFALPKVLFTSALASGDCCTPWLPWGDLPIVDFLARSRLATAPDGFQVRYLGREDLIQRLT